MDAKIANLRKEYQKASLEVEDVLDCPVAQFQKWFEDASKSALDEPNAMTLATADAEGNPAARIVLLKGVEDGGFVFYTNYHSQKGQELAKNPKAALIFFWRALERQVRITGKVAKVAPEVSDAYFQSRPFESRLGAMASPQSNPIPNRAFLEKKYQNLLAEFENKKAQRPENWGGYIVKPHFVEFWQGRPSRMHDRIAYRLQPDGSWHIERLAP